MNPRVVPWYNMTMEDNLRTGTKWLNTCTFLFPLEAGALAQALFGWWL